MIDFKIIRETTKYKKSSTQTKADNLTSVLK